MVKFEIGKQYNVFNESDYGTWYVYLTNDSIVWAN